jgi:hypothetical protein
MPDFSIIETTDTRAVEIVTPGQPSRFVRTFTALIDTANTGGAALDNSQELINELWSQYSVAIRERLTSTSSFICRRIAFEPIPDSSNFDIRAEYETFANRCDATTEGFVARPPFVRRQCQSADRMFDLYREGVTIPTNGDPVSTADIGGTAVDQQGRPIAVPINTVELQIDTLYDTTDCFDSEVAYLSYLNRRNEVEAFGFPVGQLLFRSAVISEVGPEWYQITYRILADEKYHLKQIPKLDINGNVQLTGTSGIGTAASVYWFQPYKDKVDFELLFTAEEWDYLTRTCPP